MRKWWHWLVFMGALYAVLSLVVTYAFELSEVEMMYVEEMDLLVLSIFAIDLINEYRGFRGSPTRFSKEHWLDILAVVPIFRIIRIAELAKVEELARLEEIKGVRRGEEVEEALSKTIHGRHLEEHEEE